MCWTLETCLDHRQCRTVNWWLYNRNLICKWCNPQYIFHCFFLLCNTLLQKSLDAMFFLWSRYDFFFFQEITVLIIVPLIPQYHYCVIPYLVLYLSLPAVTLVKFQQNFSCKNRSSVYMKCYLKSLSSQAAFLVSALNLHDQVEQNMTEICTGNFSPSHRIPDCVDSH